MALLTARTRLRRFTLKDFDNLRELESSAEVMRFTGPGRTQSSAESATRLRKIVEAEAERAPLGVWAAELKDGTFVGWFMILQTDRLYPELGFMMVPRAWSQGLTTEIAGRLVEYALQDLNLAGLAAVTVPENLASIGVLKKLGFTLRSQERRIHSKLGTENELLVFERRR